LIALVFLGDHRRVHQATPPLRITLDPLTSAPVRELVAAHLRLMRASSPACSVHALEIDALQTPPTQFWSAWCDQALVGCGALKPLTADHGELKSMHVLATWRGHGLGRSILAFVEAYARRAGMTRISLETGSQEAFAPAREFYRRCGYRACRPFGSYTPDPNSAFMTKRWTGAAAPSPA